MPQSNTNALRREFVNHLALLLPYGSKFQSMVYRHAELPPGLEGYQPRWEPINAVLGARQTLQVKVDVVNKFYMLALLASATTNTVGGFRVQLYDLRRKLRLQTRGFQFPQIGGGAAAPFFLREPYPFDLPKSQILAVLTNMEAVTNTVQLVLYGVVAPFEGTLSNEQ